MNPVAVDQTRETARIAAVRTYEMVCLAAMLVLGLALFTKGYDVWCLLPVLVGIAAIYLRMRAGPVLLLLALQFQMFDQWIFGWSSNRLFDVADMLQCAAVLGFVMAHYRLLGLTHSLLPADARRKTQEPSRRAVPASEVVVLAVTLGAWAVIAQLAWAALPKTEGELLLPRALWRFIVLAWVIGLALLLASGLLGYLRRELMTRDEAAMFFQDVLWTEFRGEQRQQSRWLAWARLRYHRRIARHPERSEDLP